MNALTLTLKTLATLVLLACYATTIEWHWDSDAPPPVAVLEAAGHPLDDWAALKE